MIELWNLLIDFGLVILVLIVQLIIYPGFKYYSTPEITIWHAKYTSRFTIVVMPLMLLQLGFAIYFLFLEINLYSVGNFSLITIIWLITFLKAIPLHAKISTGRHFQPLVESLITLNFWRCIFWIIIFAWTLRLYLI